VRVAEKIRLAVEQQCSTTVSLGGVFMAQTAVEALIQDADLFIEELLDRAHAAMARAKDAGRNRVVFEDDEVAGVIA